ncbi:MAG: beta-galactosidase trimerization domain-containing protein, partial [Erysipelotrichaceae bacterium]|nr:beta-galactosidase trimerization domain-containing protein [Erysipelotrichaceae bacterium]
DNPFGDYAAVVKNNYGSGRSYYMGTSLDEESLSRLFDEILKSA